ncbi:hypothetical protein KP509_04G102900 [Ceratopteris richardii]|uniref:Membrane insertase YidC/Oxa/ALB C-terminal domain-containing protein n=1 Tax=Ceratopteris richardii TaxID=49495 RepID=A0A8T2UZS2_CERRI|nr:hypothetical protein KP509_04G102900 [Ceratopteris richardii]
MAGGRQLLRKVLRHNRAPFCQPHVSCAITGLSKAIDGHEISFSNEQHVVHLSKVDNDEDRSVTTPDILSRVSKITGQCLRSQFVPSSSQRDREYTFHVDTLHSLANVGSVAFGVLSHPRGGGTFRCSHPSVYSSFNTSRHCSSASGQRLEAELGDVAAMHGNSGGFDTITADIAANLATPEARAVNDVSAIIGDCSYPTAALQLCIDFMHSHLDIPWWGAIIATTIALRIFLLPLVIYQMKSTAKLTLMRPEMEKLNEKVKNSNFDPVASSQARVEMLNLFKKYNTNPISPFIGGLLQAPIFICFFFAVSILSS